jgi:hypothetical protein
MMKPKYVLDYALIKEQIERLLQSVPNKLEREWTAPTNPAFTVLLGTVTAVGNTFRTIWFLCLDKPQDWRHLPEMALTVPLLARTIIDALYTCIFLFEDLSARADWYICAGWRELADHIDRAKRDYGSDPDWAEYIAQAGPNLDHIRTLIGKSEPELRRTEWWPTPPQMKKKIQDSATAAFFAYLDDWYYREFSQISHGTLPGLIHTAGPLRDLAKGKTMRLELTRGYRLMQVVMLLITLYSEIEAELKIGVAGDLSYIWEMLKQHYPLAKEIYDQRAGMLAGCHRSEIGDTYPGGIARDGAPEDRGAAWYSIGVATRTRHLARLFGIGADGCECSHNT